MLRANQQKKKKLQQVSKQKLTDVASFFRIRG